MNILLKYKVFLKYVLYLNDCIALKIKYDLIYLNTYSNQYKNSLFKYLNLIM